MRNSCRAEIFLFPGERYGRMPKWEGQYSAKPVDQQYWRPIRYALSFVAFVQRIMAEPVRCASDM